MTSQMNPETRSWAQSSPVMLAVINGCCACVKSTHGWTSLNQSRNCAAIAKIVGTRKL